MTIEATKRINAARDSRLGLCCTAFSLMGLTPDDLIERHGDESIDEIDKGEIRFIVENFVHLGNLVVNPLTGTTGDGMPDNLYACSRIGEDGRCTCYEDRPYLCKHYPSSKCQYTACESTWCEFHGSWDRAVDEAQTFLVQK